MISAQHSALSKKGKGSKKKTTPNENSRVTKWNAIERSALSTQHSAKTREKVREGSKKKSTPNENNMQLSPNSKRK